MALLRKGVLRLVACSSFIFLPLFAQERITVEKSSPETPATASETPIQTLYRAANQAARNRDYSLCAQFLEKVVAADRNYKNAWNYLGWTYNALGQYDKAEAALRNAIVVNPQDLNAYNNLGQALAHQKRYDEAIPEFQKQIEINAEDPWAHANLGRVYLLNKQYEKATAELEVAVTISPEDASVAFNLGRAYGKTKQPELAAEAFMKSVQLQPVPFRWNAVAYEMALDNLDLPQAEEFAPSRGIRRVLDFAFSRTCRARREVHQRRRRACSLRKGFAGCHVSQCLSGGNGIETFAEGTACVRALFAGLPPADDFVPERADR